MTERGPSGRYSCDDGDVFTPAVTHLTCDLDLQRRLREARIDAATRFADRRRGWTWKRGWIRRRPPRPRQPFVTSLRDTGDDVWHAFRF